MVAIVFRAGSSTCCRTPDHVSRIDGTAGRKRRLELEAEYWRLLQSGVGTFEVCRIVDLAHKTGYRWRGLPPVRLTPDR
jgi:hypothetical protein